MSEKVRRGRREVLYDGSSGDPTVAWFDPGGSTGWTVISVHPLAISSPDYKVMENITHYACGQFLGSEFDMVDAMAALCRSWPGAAYGTEDFILLQQNTSATLLAPVRLNAALRYEMGRKVRIHNQNAALAKTTMTDARLKDMGYLDQTIGQPHARDATRHAFTFLRRLKSNYALRKAVFPALV